MRITPTVDKFPGATPVYRETRGPVLDLEAEVGAEGYAIFLSQREIAQALATKGVLEWSRVREVLEAQGWVSPETFSELMEDAENRHEMLEACIAAVESECDTLIAANHIKAAHAPKKAAKAAA